MNLKFKGLNSSEVQNSLQKHGSNRLTEQKRETFWDKLIDNLKDPMIVILIFALVVILVLAALGQTEWYEGIGIAFAVALATLVSTFSEFKNEQTFQKLQADASKIFLNVFRDGKSVQVNIDDIVVGDQIFIQPGDKIPADGFIIDGKIKLNQAMLNGEAEPVTKKAGTVKTLDLNDEHSVFRGTIVSDGEAVIEIAKVGDATMFGELAQSLKSENENGPLRKKLATLANQIAKVGYLGAPLIAIAFMFKIIYLDNHGAFDEYFSNLSGVFHDLVMALILGVIIVVVVVPEGLPMMIAIVLAQNMKKLLKSKVLVRQLMGIETSGSMNILFSDKTGTITKGELEATGFYTIDASSKDGVKQFSKINDIPEVVMKLVKNIVFHSSSAIINEGETDPNKAIIGGNSTDKALMVFIEAHLGRNDIQEVKVLDQVLFNSKRKFSSVYVGTSQEDEKICFIKGASEKILEHAKFFMDVNNGKQPITEEIRSKLLSETDKKADDGFRIIGLALSSNGTTNEDLPDDMTLVGFCLIRDELRPDSVMAINKLQKAGIQVVMITGDRFGTAVAISKEAGLFTNGNDIALNSDELQKMSDDEVKNILPNLKVVSRCLPNDKTRLVKLAQDIGLVVGMTGDGVNDSPALSNADVGFGLGSGTEVAKEASDIVILDDRLESIVSAVHYGRTIYRSIQKFITFQLTVNVAAVLMAFIGPFIGFELPLTVIQLLWINLIMDTLAALAFSGEPPLIKHLEESPKSKTEHIITSEMWNSILINGIFMTILCSVFLIVPEIHELFYRENLSTEANERIFLTAFFALFVFLNNWNKFNVRVEDLRLLHHLKQNLGFVYVVALIFIVQVILTYFGGELFRTSGLNLNDWVYIVLISILIIPFDLLRKAIFANKGA